MSVLEQSPRHLKERLDHRNLVITIDGSTTAGKRLIGERLADRYDLSLLNTGTTIRALALVAIEHGIVHTSETNVTDIPVDLSDRVAKLYDTMPEKLTIARPTEGDRTARVMVGDRDMQKALLSYGKQKAIENLSSIIAASPVIRWKLYQLWRAAVRDLGGVVVIGRKTGLDLFPAAPIKLYFFASPEASASYRVIHDPTATLHKGSEERYVREVDGMDSMHGLLDRPVNAFVVDTSQYISKNGKGVEALETLIASYIDGRFEIR